MRRRFAISLLLISVLAPTSGCRSPGSPLAQSPFGAKSSSSDDSRFMSLFKSSQKQVASKDDTASKNEKSLEDSGVRQASATQNDSEFDADTEAIIERKLAGATPEQRAKMRSALVGVPANLVPQILNTFQLGQQFQQESQDSFAASRTPYGPTNPPSIANRSRRERDRAGVAYDNTGQEFANVRGNSRFAPQHPDPLINDPYHNAQQQPQAFPGGPSPVMQTGHDNAAFQNNSQLRQADWSTPQNPQNVHTATRIGEYNPVMDPGMPQHNSQNNIAQVGHQASRPLQPPIDDLPLYNQPGQNRRDVIGLLKPGEFNSPQNSPPMAASLPQGAIQQANVTSSLDDPTTFQQPPSNSPATMAWRSQLGQIIAAAEREVAQLRPGVEEDAPATRDYIENNVYLRMLYLMSGNADQQARAWEPIPGLDPAQQEFWQYMMYGYSNYFDRNPQLVGLERYGEAVKSFGRATSQLRSKANLEIGDIAFCSSITNFGNYKRFETYEFSPGQQVVLYAEIRNFTSRLTEENHYQTRLTSTIEFIIPGAGPMSGRTVHNAIEMQPTEDLCKYPRQDFFIASLFSIPRDLAQGRYVLKLTVTDKLGQKFAESTLNFKIK